MNYKTPFYFVTWMLARLWSRVAALPKRRHDAITRFYRESTGMFVFAFWALTVVGSGVTAIVALLITQSTDNFVLVGKTWFVISFCYFVYIVLHDQFRQFDAERQRTWSHLKD